ncbi:hypothetical protein RND81_08G045600 [Saponaria officinalis]|uniref:Uncharacterized protein n=1 Tax=Saponaria officinalis TaxID=3572 RepID=A0AAW1J512_SAPOF
MNVINYRKYLVLVLRMFSTPYNTPTPHPDILSNTTHYFPFPSFLAVKPELTPPPFVFFFLSPKLDLNHHHLHRSSTTAATSFPTISEDDDATAGDFASLIFLSI